MSYVYSRYRIEAVMLSIMNLSPLQGAGATPLYVRYAPAELNNPVSLEQIADTTGFKLFNPNKLSMSTWCFKPRFSGNPQDSPAQPTAVPDSDGYMPFQLNNFGFVQPYMGCIQYWQEIGGSLSEKEWQATITFFVRCSFSV